ncbi:protein CURVATURE THYLAKOID 1B, chloroplastic [Cinnamomum micranthum f. kanehirae]|uniref:Protein CURVATURE THYLAKOID 1B, chloroplastic n=1 Tax=Cinnamomum micranthum f. kanehirae TaxID=337451 RepID=A0A443PFI8_9MAGN|nr:protein CURVATURE THYLAKOID 1B, chloroplastic [Cinnamomum micranthum f. kanehirae]
MASTSTNISLSSSTTLIDRKAPRQQPPSPHCVALPTLPPSPLPPRSRPSKATSYCHKIARNVMAMAAGESSMMATGEAMVDMATTELPQIVKTIQEAWDKVEDKYAVTSLALAGAVALWGTGGVISAIDRLPLVPGALETVGIGYSGWFAYRNLVFKPDREALIKKIKDTYKDIIGSS